jgi:hypothetical protein
LWLRQDYSPRKGVHCISERGTRESHSTSDMVYRIYDGVDSLPGQHRLRPHLTALQMM